MSCGKTYDGKRCVLEDDHPGECYDGTPEGQLIVFRPLVPSLEVIKQRVTVTWCPTWPPSGALLVECTTKTGEALRFPVELGAAPDVLRRLEHAVDATAREVRRLESS